MGFGISDEGMRRGRRAAGEAAPAARAAHAHAAATHAPASVRPAAGEVAGASFSARGAGDARPVRVLLVGPSTDILGGQAVQLERLLGRFREEPGLEVGFVPVNPRLPGALRRLQAVRYVRTVATSLAYWWLLLRRVPRYDVIHIFSASYTSFVIAPTPALLAARLFGKKTVLNYRSGECEDHLRRWRRTAVPTVRRFDLIAVPSGYLVDVFARFGFAARAVFNFVDSARFRFRERRPLAPRFLSNRNHESLYNVEMALRAFALVQERCPDASLLVAGDGSLRPSLERLARELGLRGVQFVGRVPNERMPALYAAADIYLNTPNVDNMPGSIIEAYASGLAVVTTDAGGVPYIVRDGETGLVVPRGDHERMARAALRLLEDDALAQRLIAGAREECRRYSWEAVRGEWLDIYRGLAGRGAALETARAEAGGPSAGLNDAR
ncbi:MAG TPA: glycosyltransferase family 4 protein [Pyrinomonadaceae bacterium]|nr:glycosyltransferase family 4 protein [Pyrinomonadaceae bacterium]